jgi:hypothetical protein
MIQQKKQVESLIVYNTMYIFWNHLIKKVLKQKLIEGFSTQKLQPLIRDGKMEL